MGLNSKWQKWHGKCEFECSVYRCGHFYLAHADWHQALQRQGQPHCDRWPLCNRLPSRFSLLSVMAVYQSPWQSKWQRVYGDLNYLFIASTFYSNVNKTTWRWKQSWWQHGASRSVDPSYRTARSSVPTWWPPSPWTRGAPAPHRLLRAPQGSQHLCVLHQESPSCSASNMRASGRKVVGLGCRISLAWQRKRWCVINWRHHQNAMLW